MLMPVRSPGKVNNLISFDTTGSRINRVRPNSRKVVQVESNNLAVVLNGNANSSLMLSCMNVG